MKTIFFKERWYDSKEALWSAENRAFKYGDALFETISFDNDKIWFVEQHLNRLSKACTILKMDIPEGLDEAKINIAWQSFSTKNKATYGSIRLQVFRKNGHKYAPRGEESDYVIEFNLHQSCLFGSKSKGQSAISFKEHTIQSESVLSNIKSSNSLIYILAKEQALQQKKDDCVLYNNKGQLAEMSSSNLYLDFGDQIITPPLQSGCLDGVTRKILLLQNKIPIIEEELNLKDLKKAKSVYSSNAIEGLKWYSTVDDFRFSKGKVDQLNLLLRS